MCRLFFSSASLIFSSLLLLPFSNKLIHHPMSHYLISLFYQTRNQIIEHVMLRGVELGMS